MKTTKLKSQSSKEDAWWGQQAEGASKEGLLGPKQSEKFLVEMMAAYRKPKKPSKATDAKVLNAAKDINKRYGKMMHALAGDIQNKKLKPQSLKEVDLDWGIDYEALKIKAVRKKIKKD